MLVSVFAVLIGLPVASYLMAVLFLRNDNAPSKMTITGSIGVAVFQCVIFAGAVGSLFELLGFEFGFLQALILACVVGATNIAAILFGG